MKIINPAIHASFTHLIVAALLLGGLNACQSIGSAFAPAPVDPDKRIALKPGGPHQGTADTGDLVVAYAYQLTPDSLFHVTGGIRSIRFGADTANVYLNFLDDTGRAIERKVIYASGYRRDVYIRRPSTFDTTLPLPPDATAIAFSSYVQASSGRK